MTELPDVLSSRKLSNSFLSDTIQVCIVTHDHKKCMEGFVRLGIGPWRVFTFDSAVLRHATYNGEKVDHSSRICLARHGSTLWEIIEPLEGPSIYRDFLEQHGEGVQHVAVAAEGMDFDQQVAEFGRRGFPVTQSGEVAGGARYAYFDTEGATHTTFEIIQFGGAIEPEAWYPAPPPPKA